MEENNLSFKSGTGENMPEEYSNGNILNISETVGVGEWLLTLILMFIPLVNLIMLIVWAVSAKKRSKKNYARAMLIVTAVLTVLLIGGSAFGWMTRMTPDSLVTENVHDEKEDRETDVEENKKNDEKEPVTEDEETPTEQNITITPYEEDPQAGNTKPSTGIVPGAASGTATSYTLNIGGMDLTIPFQSSWEVYPGDYIISAYPDDADVALTYSDSFVEVGDMDALTKLAENIEKTSGISAKYGEFTLNGVTNYAINYTTDYSGQMIALYQDIGGTTYLEVEIQDFNAKYQADDLISAYCVSIQ